VTSALVSAHGLADLLGGGEDVVVADASAVLLPPRFEGDHSAGSGRDEWLSERIPLSIHLDLTDDLADASVPFHFTPPPAQQLADRLAARGIGRDTHVITYDQGGLLWAARVWWTLRSIGIRVSVLDGGLPAWGAEHLVDRGGDPPSRKPAPLWKARAVRDSWATADEVAAISAGDAPGTLVCGLNASLFAGTAMTRYARRGHIPGSINVPARGHVGADGRLQPIALLRADWASLPRGPVVVYCGGGISASLNALALHEIGVTDVRIYDGSLEEWARDPDRPLVVSNEGAAPLLRS
jgi:thiosulfate/3-mercaptopyruvate sulfurtransferase